MYDLFEDHDNIASPPETIAPGAVLLRGFTLSINNALIEAVNDVIRIAPAQKMHLASGGKMSTGISNCGTYGWISNTKGYRYSRYNPQTNKAWPIMPTVFKELASNAADKAGYKNFIPDSCLINCYEPHSKMGLHQDKDEQDASAPIVSVSLGLPAIFLFGGLLRSNKHQRIRLTHSDVIVWGGPTRYAFHGIETIDDGFHNILGRQRVNLTFRKVY